MPFCPKCGTEVPENINFCQKCGNVLQTGQAENLSLWEYYIKVLKNYVNFKGRARRKEFFGFVLFTFIIGVALLVLTNIVFSVGEKADKEFGFVYVSYALYALVVSLPSLSVCSRRFHDIGKSGWLCLLCLLGLWVPAVWIIILIWLCKDSQSGENKYGPNPKEVCNQQKGSFTDSRDGKTYKTVTIGGQTWLAENLNYEVNGSKCYDNNPVNAQKYGRLYDWETAKKACPSGWHLPSDTEWNNLVEYIGGPYTAGTSLASVNWAGMNDNGERWVGIDKYGFSALPGGYGNFDGSFNNVGNGGYWWVASEEWNAGYKNGKDAFYSIGASMNVRDSFNGHLYSVRCLQD